MTTSEAPASTSPSRRALYDAAGRSPGALPPSLPEHVRQQLERDIIERRLVPGERLAEATLAIRIGVSRTPVREAIATLERQGLVVRQRSRGARVAPETTLAEATALYELRASVEGFLAARAAEAISAGELDLLRELQGDFQRELEREAAHGDPPRLAHLVSLDSDIHWTIYNAAGSSLASVVGSYWGRMLRELHLGVYRSAHPRRFARQHEAIIAALAARRAATARAAMIDHVRDGLRALRADFQARDAAPDAVGAA